MEKFKVSFVANNQQLTATGTKHASDTYADIEATFTLGERWTDMDSVSAVWWNDFTRIATVLDSEGKCTVPYEVLTRKGCVRVNLVGSVVEDGELVTRLTSYSAEAVHVNEKIKLTGNEPQTITPSQFEQFVENVKADADRAESAKESAQDASASAQGYAQSASASATSASESATASEQAATASARDAQTVSEIAVEVEVMKNEAELARDEILGMRAEAVTLPAGSEATASYADGLLSLGIPRGNTGATGAKGDKGDTGATPNLTIGNVETLEPTESATATITGTAENPVLNLGIPQGDTGEVSLADLSTLLPTDTASGDIASFPDGQSVIPLLSLIADIEPIQSGTGTPSPDNVRPISGHTEVNTQRTGKNLWGGLQMAQNMHDAINNESSCSFGSDDSGEYVTLKASAPIDDKPLTNGVKFKEGTQYTIIIKGKKNNTNGSFNLIFRYTDGSLGYIGASSVQADEVVPFHFVSAVGKTIKSISSTWASGTAYFYYEDCGIFEGVLTADDFEPYLGDTYTTPLGQTVYGGTLDVVSGELVVDRAMVDLGTLNWGGIALGTESARFLTHSIKDIIKFAPSNYQPSPYIISSQYQVYSVNQGLSVDASIVEYATGELYVRDVRYNDVTSFKTAMNGVQLCYELATPQTIQLTPQEVRTLLGTNNVWADSGSVSVTYKADVTKWVEKKFS